MQLNDFLKDTSNKFGMPIRTSNDLVVCLEGYDYFEGVYYTFIEEAIKECIKDVRHSGKPFENIKELISHISHNYI